MTGRLEGCAIVTGSSSGIGAAIASGLAADGWRVGGINRRSQAATAATHTVFADVREPAALERAFTELQDALGPVLVLVNNAGFRHAPAVAAALDHEAVQETLATNVAALVTATRLALPTMLRARWGRIVNIASIAGLIGSPGLAAYGAAKAGVIAYTRTVAMEVASRNVTVNAVAPGLIATEGTRDVDERVRAAIPARRAGAPDEVAACVRFLVSDAAAYVNGATIAVDGGLSAGVDPTLARGEQV